MGKGQTFYRQSRVGSGRVNVSQGRVGSKKSDPWTTLVSVWHGDRNSPLRVKNGEPSPSLRVWRRLHSDSITCNSDRYLTSEWNSLLICVCQMLSVNPHMADKTYKTYSSSGVGVQNIRVNWMHKSKHIPDKIRQVDCYYQLLLLLLLLLLSIINIPTETI